MPAQPDSELDLPRAASRLAAPGPDLGLAPIGRLDHSFADLAYRAILEAIVSLALPPGSVLSERQLGERLQVSKTPIREALARLEMEGFAITVPYRGTLVTTLSQDDIREIFDLRLILEGHAVHQAVLNARPTDTAALRQRLEAAVSAEARGDYAAFSDANHTFHQWFLEHAWNQRLRLQVANLEAHTRRIRAATAPVWGAIGMRLDFHWELLAAVEEGNAELAREVVQRDIRAFETLLLTHTSAEMLSLLGSNEPSR
jgi:DNA-binding GntR family transcriptional regulator